MRSLVRSLGLCAAAFVLPLAALAQTPSGAGASKSPRLSVAGNAAGSIVDLGAVRFGRPAVASVTLRNDSPQPLRIERIASSCQCTSVVLQDGSAAPHATVAPGAAVTLRLSIDTARLADAALSTAREFREEVHVYAAGETVHPAVVIYLRGRITSMVAFDPPFLDLGRAPAVKGAGRTIQATFEPGVYQPGRTRLVASAALPLTLAALGAPTRLPDGRMRCRYMVAVPAGAPIGTLAGVIRAEGLGAVAGAAPGGSPDVLAIQAIFTGHVVAEPALLAFAAPASDAPPPVLHGPPLANPPGAARPSGNVDADASRGRRTRWALLVWQDAAPDPRAKHVLGPKAAARPWEGATVELDGPGLDAVLVPAIDQRSPDRTRAGLGPPALTTTALRPENVRWLQVTARTEAFAAANRATRVQVRLACGERLRLPVLWPRVPVASVASTPSTSPPRVGRP